LDIAAMNPKQIKRVDIEMLGRTEGDHPCPVCQDADPFFRAAAQQKHDRVGYKKIEIDSPEGQKHPKLSRIKGVPFTQRCITYKSGRMKCKDIEGFRREEWDILDKI